MSTAITVKEYLEQTYLLDAGFWYEVHITPSTPWMHITLIQLERIAILLDESITQILRPNH